MGLEAWLFTLWQEHYPRVMESMMLSFAFGPKGIEVTVGRSKPHEELNNSYAWKILLE